MEIRGIVTTTVLILALITISTTSASADSCWIANTSWDAPAVGDYAVPAFADLDDDGDYDLLIGEICGESYGYENIGSASSPVWTGRQHGMPLM
ncbi:MAG: hypothetical protein C5S49_04990 [Candidatus Methanogaster sp.]|nr:MAG: hypothetical protein C5S49_04990 [ANME-2 cluster archaeon]